jgi:hypothetical protein
MQLRPFSFSFVKLVKNENNTEKNQKKKIVNGKWFEVNL